MTARGNGIDTKLASLREQIHSLEREKQGLSAVKADRERVVNSEYREKVAKYEADLAAYEEYADQEIQPVESLLKEAEHTEKMKSHVNEWRRMLSLQEEIKQLAGKSASYTEKIEKARSLPGEILEKTSIHIQGLSV